ncbi:MAG: imidazole glycerol phosphate synthase subunit HisH [Cellvibrionaceae bacterium]|nr:imidazole glycerol phosphate synthase subunit HisH [Cellvibrionaceae bacterium]
MKNHIAVIDYGMGNLHSVASALQHVAPDAQVEVTSDIRRVRDADRVLFPGVGAIRDCMAEIRRLKFDTAIADTIASGKPLLAICVGLQSLMDSSEENGGVPCLGHFAGEVKGFANSPEFLAARAHGAATGERLKVPHMGWNQVRQMQSHPLWHGIPDNSRFYFVHSYCVQSRDAQVIAGHCHYGIDFSAALARANVFAAQFHPEKSAEHGLQLLKNFVGWNGQP